jgi:hypothetical protein
MKKIYIIPGNPPSEYFYEKWANELTEKYSTESLSCEVGYSSFPLISQENISSQNYIQEIKSYYQAKIIEFSKGEEVTLIGHSFGCYIANLLINDDEIKISHCYNIFPFIGAPTLKGKLTLTFANLLGINQNFKSFFISNKILLNKVQKEIKHITSSELAASIELGIHESKLFKYKLAKNIFNNADKNTIIHNKEKDTWCNPRTIKLLRKKHVCHSTTAMHDFVVHKSERNLITDLLFSIIE